VVVGSFGAEAEEMRIVGDTGVGLRSDELRIDTLSSKWIRLVPMTAAIVADVNTCKCVLEAFPLGMTIFRDPLDRAEEAELTAFPRVSMVEVLCRSSAGRSVVEEGSIGVVGEVVTIVGGVGEAVAERDFVSGKRCFRFV
jgi:hypothetical protein